MSEVRVNKLSPRSGTTVTLGDSGDTISIPSGVTLDASSGGLAGTLTTAAQPNITSVGTLTSFTSTGIDDNATSTTITIDSSERVGIGTASPSAKLYVDANADGTISTFQGDINLFKIIGSGADTILSTEGSGGNASNLFFQTDPFVSQVNRMQINKDGDISFYEDTGTTPKFFWDASAERLGIGTSSPSQLLEVSATSGLASGSGTTNAIRIADVGAGSSWSTTQDFSQLQFSSTDTSNPGGSGVRYSIGVVSHDAANTYSDLTFRNYDGTEHMRINGALGNVGIGTTSPSSSYRLSVVGGTGAVVGAFIETTSTDSGHEASIIKRPNSGVLVQFLGSGQVGSITTNGSTTTYGTSSDYRLKENVVDLTNATERLKQLQPKRFNFISDKDTTVDGFIAHEVSSVVPEAIHGTKDEVDVDGNPKYQNIDQSKLVPLLVKTIQELEARITTLENA